MIEQPEDSGPLWSGSRFPTFSGSGPGLPLYFRHPAQKLIFGDCIRGMAPQGRLFICQYASCEEPGQCSVWTINRLEEGYEELSVINEDSAFGGCDLKIWMTVLWKPEGLCMRTARL